MFLAGCSYGVMVPLVRTAQFKGFVTGQIMVTQYLVAAIALALLCLLFSRKKVAFKDVFKLIGVGVTAAGVSFFYYQSLALLLPATSLTLLFQFVWMGMVFQAISTKVLPKLASFLVVLLVLFGAVLATGIMDEGVTLESLDPLGILWGFLSAVCYTAFLVLSGNTSSKVPTLNRTLFITLGSLAISLVISHQYLTSEMLVVADPFVGLTLGIAGICLPVYLIALSSPKLPPALTTIMASSELPSGVIFAAIFIGEPVTLTIGIGVIIVLVGIVASEWETLRRLVFKPVTMM